MSGEEIISEVNEIDYSSFFEEQNIYLKNFSGDIVEIKNDIDESNFNISAISIILLLFFIIFIFKR